MVINTVISCPACCICYAVLQVIGTVSFIMVLFRIAHSTEVTSTIGLFKGEAKAVCMLDTPSSHPSTCAGTYCERSVHRE